MDDMIKRYKKVSTFQNLNLVAFPIPYVCRVKKADIKRGFIERRFVQKVNDRLSPVTEVSQNNYLQLAQNPLFNTIKLRWRIDGTKEEIKNSNRASISEHLGKMPQLKNRLVNLLEYSKK
tara:strand:+ start:402 stop:761 length:360 start_codon:yes stop_codon:yes gene_type:complete